MLKLEVKQEGLPEAHGFMANLAGALTDGLWLHREIGQIVAGNIKDDIEHGGNPDGAFQPTDPAMVEIEGKGHDRPLIWKGRLQKSIKDVAGASGVAVGSPLPYAKRMFTGGKNRIHSIEFRRKGVKVVNVWPRPYLGVWGRDVQELLLHIRLRAATGSRR